MTELEKIVKDKQRKKDIRQKKKKRQREKREKKDRHESEKSLTKASYDSGRSEHEKTVNENN